MSETLTVTGEIIMPDGALPDRAAEIVVRIEDISRADAPSTVIAEQRQRGVRLRRVASLPFSVAAPAAAIAPQNLYSVSVHVDIAGSGEVQRGDYVSTQSHPVLTLGHGRSARIPLRRV